MRTLTLVLLTLLCLSGCSDNEDTPNNAATGSADSSASNTQTDCGFTTITLSDSDAKRFKQLEAQLLDVIAEIESSESDDQYDARAQKLIWTEVWLDLAWLRSRIGDSTGSKQAMAQVMDKGDTNLATLTALAKLPGSDTEAILVRAKKEVGVNNGEVPYELTDHRSHRVREDMMALMHQRCMIAGFYAFMGDDSATSDWTQGFDPEYFWGGYFHSVAQHHIALGHLAAGRADEAQALARGWEQAKQQKGQPINLELHDALIARALRCGGRAEAALAKLESIADRPSKSPQALALLASEFVAHGKDNRANKAIARITELYDAAELDTDGEHRFFNQIREEFVEPLARYGFTDEADAIIDRARKVYKPADQPSHNAMWKADNTAHLLAAAHRLDEAVQYADVARTISIQMNRPNELPQISRIVLALSNLRESQQPAALIQLEQYDGRPDELIVAARDTAQLANQQLKFDSDAALDDAPLLIRCGALLGEMHAIVQSRLTINQSAIIRDNHHR